MTGEMALEYLEAAQYDAAVLDIMMPRLDGLEVVKNLRRRGNLTPVLFLTARDTVADKVKGLDMGANDYLVKPFSFDELMARIRVMTRTSVQNPTNQYVIADLMLDAESHQVFRAGQEIKLTAREFALLEYLLRNKGRGFSHARRSRIMSGILIMTGGTNVVDVYITYLRKKIDDGYGTKLIHTVRGVGYLLKETI